MVMHKLFIFGDSIFKGVTYSGETGRYSLFKSSLASRLAEHGIKLINSSKMGATIDKGIEIMNADLAECGDGDTVLIEYGGNDCNFDWKKVSENPDGEFSPRTEESAFREQYGIAIEKARKTGAKVFASTLFPLDSEKFFGYITKGLDPDGILHWLGDKFELYRWQEYYSSLVQDIAHKHGCQVIDLRSDIAKLHNLPSLVCDDGIHPTLKAHEMIENILYNFFVPESERLPEALA